MDLYFVPAGRMGEEFALHKGVEDRLLDTLTILELQGDLARTNISNARAAFKRLFPPTSFPSKRSRRFSPSLSIVF
jgi:hypothetical protein